MPDQTLQRMVMVGNFKKFQGELVALVSAGAGNVAPLFETHQHAEYLSQGAAKAAGDFTVGHRFGD
jgi:hypothetical protein